MRKYLAKFFLVFICLLIFLSFFPLGSLAITREECVEKIESGIELSLDELSECEVKLEEAKEEAVAQKRSLEAEVKKFNAAVAMTASQILGTTEEIKELEEEIASLSTKIDRLDFSLDQISAILIQRIGETYKKGRLDTFALFLSSRNFSEFINRYKYLKVIQLHDKQLMVQMETVRTDFQGQKTAKEEKQEELEIAKKKLETQKVLLAQQKADKEKLLEITQNNERRYQQLLATTRAEIEAIQRIIAGEGECSEASNISQGQKVASVIVGASACSLGTHLHFEIREESEVRNPFAYLKNISLIDDSGIGSFGGDPHSATGSWDWPLNEPIRFTQGFGSNTAFIRSGASWYDFHTGIDLVSDDLTVKAVKQGKLYRCSIGCGSGTLRYVQVDHDDSNLDTYYLHVNY